MHRFHPNFFIIHPSRMTFHSHTDITEQSALVLQTVRVYWNLILLIIWVEH